MAPDELADAISAGDRRALAKAITLVESNRTEDRLAARRLLSLLPPSEPTLRLGVTGPPGAGKSTFIDKLGVLLVARGYRPAVLAYDPSGKQGGSLLADKTRMAQLTSEPGAFVRPSPNRGLGGGVGPAALSAVRLCEAAHYAPVIVETVGVGQSELGVVDIVDLCVLLLLPNSGDELQGMKKGILEHASLVLVNKADGEQRSRARAAAQQARAALTLLSGRPSEEPRVEVLTLSALQGEGVERAWDYLSQYFAQSLAAGRVASQRQRKLLSLFRRQLILELERQLLHTPTMERVVEAAERRLLAGTVPVEDAVDEVLQSALAAPER